MDAKDSCSVFSPAEESIRGRKGKFTLALMQQIKKMKRKKKKMKRSPCRGLNQSSFSIVSNLVKGPRVPFPVAGTTMTEIPSLSQHLRDQNLFLSGKNQDDKEFRNVYFYTL